MGDLAGLADSAYEQPASSGRFTILERRS